MMKNFATKPAVKTVFLLAGICLAFVYGSSVDLCLGQPRSGFMGDCRHDRDHSADPISGNRAFD